MVPVLDIFAVLALVLGLSAATARWPTSEDGPRRAGGSAAAEPVMPRALPGLLGLVVLALMFSDGRGGANAAEQKIFVLAMATWAAGLAAAGGADALTQTVPRLLVRRAVASTLLLLLCSCAVSGNWACTLGAAGCWTGAWAVMGLWRAVSPRSIGLGDVRLASLGAFGLGALAPGLSLACVSVALLGAAFASRFGSRASGRPVPVALGPFMVAGCIGGAVVFGR